MPRSKALVLGCGNIGAEYDLHNDNVIHTHVRALSKYKTIELTVADLDPKKAAIVAKHYKVSAVALDNIRFTDYSLICLATPTSTHFTYLKELLLLNIPVVVCEKPVGGNLKELADLKRAYSKSKSRVLVNYMRRFLPEMAILKKRIQKIQKKENLSQVKIIYNRGFLNNGSHAVDLLEFLFDEEFRFERFSVQAITPGAHKDDPTVNGKCRFGYATIHFVGMVESAFEIELHFEHSKILIADRGNSVRYFQSKKKDTFEEIMRLQQTNILTAYMKPVIAKAIALQNKQNTSDNFLQALTLNERTLRLLNKIDK